MAEVSIDKLIPSDVYMEEKNDKYNVSAEQTVVVDSFDRIC